MTFTGFVSGHQNLRGKRLSGASRRLPNRVAQALKLAAQGLHHSPCALGAYYRRMAARPGAGKAITATAHKLARLIYAMPTHRAEYAERSMDDYEAQFRERTLAHMRRRAAQMGFTLQPVAAV